MNRASLNLSQSQHAYATACAYIAGGVDSPVRAFKSVESTPIFYHHAQGCTVTDIDNNVYTDYIGSWGPMILGHKAPCVVEALKQQLECGTSYGAPCLGETRLAQLIQQCMPSIERIRFVSSGTEATMAAVRLARGYTNRSKCIKFEGNYHGHSDALLASAGSGCATFGLSDEVPGVTHGALQDMLCAEYNNIEQVQKFFAAYPSDIACVIVEPVAANMGVVLPENNFLQSLRQLCTQYGALLIFDEVITGFRSSLGGAQQYFDVKPDITCLGKIIGGGLPVGAFGGAQEIMDCLAPTGSVYQAGTLSGNPLAMAAGCAQISYLIDHEDEVYPYLDELGMYLEKLLQPLLERHKGLISFTRHRSLATLFFSEHAPVNYTQARRCNTHAFARYFQHMLNHHILIAPSQFEALFLSTQHTQHDIEKFVHALEHALLPLQLG